MANERIGVLALQGDAVEHVSAFARLGIRAYLVKVPSELAAVDALIIPGGESTTVMKLMQRAGLDGPIRERVHQGMPLWGTCMGMIVASKGVDGVDQPTLGVLDVTVKRNAFGRQIASAEIPLQVPALGSQPFPAVFIRAPWIERVGESVDVLAYVDGHPVFVREGAVMGTSFHPELSGDSRVHAYFLSLLAARQEQKPSVADLSFDEAGEEIFPSASRAQ